MSNKLRIPVLLMVLTIVVITGFQAYWLHKNYEEEKKAFTTQTNILFRETLFHLQAFKLKLDTGLNIRLRQKESVVGMVNVLRTRARDTGTAAATEQIITRSPGGATMIISVDDHKRDTVKARIERDSTNVVRYMRRESGPGNRVFDFLTGVDSLQEPITQKEVVTNYTKALLEEKITVPFSVTVTPAPERRGMMPLPPDPEDNKVTIGFSKPITYQVNFENVSWFLLKKLKQPILVSFLLVGVTTFSFLMLYRNIVRQRKLTQLKNDFISNITHELKTPIATVSVAIEALKSFNALNDPKRTQEYLDISANELQRLSLLVDKVLKLAMFEKKAIELKKELFDLKDLTIEVMTTMRLLFEKHHAKVNFTATGENFMIEADKLHLTSVIYNLLDNALKYSNDNPVINVQLSLLPNDILELKVNDNGIGIPNEYRYKIFTKFFRVPTGDKHNIKGYGLGLSYVSEVIKRHMGFILVESELGIGSTFIVKVPVKEADVIYFDEHRRVIKRKIKLW